MTLLDTGLVAFTTFFAMVGPIEVAVIFAALTPHETPAVRRHTALKATVIAAAILLVFALIGDFLLERLGISLAALRTAGGVLLLLLGIDLVFAKGSGGTTTTADERSEAQTRHDISVFPLATPLIAGPGAIAMTILLIGNAEGDLVQQGVIVLSMFVVLAITCLMLLSATQVQKLMGITGLKVVNRVFGVLVTALAVQFLFDGIRESGLLSTG